MAGKKLLMIVGDYVEDLETYVPFQALQMVGHTVHAVSPGKAAGETVQTAVHDFLPGKQTYTEFTGHTFAVNYNFTDVKPEDYDGLVVPGGRAPEFLRNDKTVIAWVRHFAEAKKPIAAICHGPQILTAADVIKDRKVTAYPALEADVRAAGGKWEAIAVDDALVDGNLVTAPAWPAHARWLRAFLDLLGTKITP